MLNELQYVGCSVRAVQVHVALCVIDKSLIARWFEILPCVNEVLDHADIRSCLDVKITGVEETADVQPRDQLQRLVLRIGGGALPVQIEVVGIGRCLPVSLLEGFTVPHPVGLVHVHVIHMYRNPYIAGGIGNLVVYILFNDKVIGDAVAVTDIVNTGGVDRGKIELHIVVLEIIAPGSDLTGEYLCRITIVANLVD